MVVEIGGMHPQKSGNDALADGGLDDERLLSAVDLGHDGWYERVAGLEGIDGHLEVPSPPEHGYGFQRDLGAALMQPHPQHKPLCCHPECQRGYCAERERCCMDICE